MKRLLKAALTPAGAILLSSLLICPTLSAGTVSYIFNENGWVNNFGTSEDLTGSFTGTLDTNGDLSLGSLSSFSATLTESNGAGAGKVVAVFNGIAGRNGLTQFLFSSSLNTLNLAANDAAGDLVCLGTSVTAGACGPVPPRAQPKPGVAPLPPFEGDFVSAVNGQLSALTTATPDINEIAVIQPVPAPPTAIAPEPGKLGVFGAAILLFSFGLRRWTCGA